MAAIPEHVAIIMDGNGRWAKSRRLPRTEGHRRGIRSVRKTVAACLERGVRILTLFTFSSENWRRPAAEVRTLMDLFLFSLRREIDKLDAQGVRLAFIGEQSIFSPALQSALREATERTRSNDRLQLIIAANYGGRWDIEQAAVRYAEALARQDAETSCPPFAHYLSTGELRDPDLLIRTGGERRISNFLLWQLAYTELYFTDVLWPDFDGDELGKALDDYASRQRRFGRTGDQVGVQDG